VTTIPVPFETISDLTIPKVLDEVASLVLYALLTETLSPCAPKI
jgi:hypothetical protein